MAGGGGALTALGYRTTVAYFVNLLNLVSVVLCSLVILSLFGNYELVELFAWGLGSFNWGGRMSL